VFSVQEAEAVEDDGLEGDDIIFIVDASFRVLVVSCTC